MNERLLMFVLGTLLALAIAFGLDHPFAAGVCIGSYVYLDRRST